MTSMRRRPAAAAFTLLLAALGLWLLGAGAYLVVLGGSFYYVLAGSAVAASALLLWRGSVWADRLYALNLLATLGWALWETGGAAWSLLPRLLLPTVLGLGFILVQRGRESPPDQWRRAISPSGAAAALCIVVFAAACLRPLSTSVPERPAGAGDAIATTDTDTEWRHYGNTLQGTRYSPLAQITPASVRGLEVAWIHRAGGPQAANDSGQATPLKVGDTLYTCTANSVVIALDARTGKERWRFDPRAAQGNYAQKVCRGVSYHRAEGAEGACAGRILAPTIDARLFALDAATGRPCAGFGKDGAISLLDGMGEVPPTYHFTTSPPTVAGGHVVLGGLVFDNQSVDMPSGVIRSFDPVTGALQWAWDMGAPERIGAPGPGETYTRSTPNAWPPFAADPTLNLVYVPIGNPSPDFYGVGRRPFDEAYGSSVVALDLDTGRPRWSFQTVHHDLWDYDVSSQPLLVDLPAGGGTRPALVQATKQGDIYVLDRRDGTPILPVTERPVPQAGARERLSPTQPFSTISVADEPLTEAAMWGLTPADQLMCRIKFRQSRYEGIYTPPGTDPTIQYPGLTGGVNWGSLSFDPRRNAIIVNALHFPWRVRLVPRAEVTPELAAERWSPMMVGTPYAWAQDQFFGPLEIPCAEPPWGTLRAIDLGTGKVIWKQVLGTGRDSGPFGIPTMLPLPVGVPNMGGTLTTGGGLIFVGATLDRYLRAYDLASGKELWRARLPAGAQATPMTYMAGGRQYVVVTAGGHSFLGTKQGDYTIAYALPPE